MIFISLLSCSENNDKEKLTVKILPGYGAIIENDTIVLGRTSIEELKEKFRLDTTLIPGVYLGGDDMTIDSIYSAIYSFKTIEFDYQSKISLDSIKLSIITVYPSDSLIVMLDSVNMNGKNLDIKRIFPDIKDSDLIKYNGLKYILFSYGIYINLDEKDNDRYIKSISIFPKFIIEN
jgi:hypothetical protein